MSESNSNSKLPFWVNDFHIDESTWGTLVSQAARQNNSPLDIALDMGLLNENKLIMIDRDNSKMMSLHSVFFNAPAPLDLFKEFDYLSFRAQACMPIGKWDNAVILAKLTSLPTGLEEKYKSAIWVLAPWTGLKKWFASWEELVMGDGRARRVIIPKPNGISSIKPDALPLDKAVSKALKVDEPQQEDLPQGLVDLQKPVNTNLDFSKVFAKEIPTADKEVTRDLASGIKESKIPSQAPEAASLSEETRDFSALVKPKTPPPLPDATKPFIQPPPPPAPTAEHNFFKDILTTPAPDTGQAKAPTTPPHAPEAVPQAAQEFLKSFETLLMFEVHNQDLKVFRAMGSWAVTPAPGQVIHTNQPSIFKIVLTTGQPYHGPVSRGAGNENFFKLFTKGEYPEHVSVLPVMNHGKISHLILASGSSAKAARIPLANLQKMAHDLSMSFGNGSHLKVS